MQQGNDRAALVAELQLLTRQRNDSIAGDDWQAAQATEKKRLVIAQQIFAGGAALSLDDELRRMLEEMLHADAQTLAAVRERQRSVGGDMSYLRRGREANDAYQTEAAR